MPKSGKKWPKWPLFLPLFPPGLEGISVKKRPGNGRFWHALQIGIKTAKMAVFWLFLTSKNGQNGRILPPYGPEGPTVSGIPRAGGAKSAKNGTFWHFLAWVPLCAVGKWPFLGVKKWSKNTCKTRVFATFWPICLAILGEKVVKNGVKNG